MKMKMDFDELRKSWQTQPVNDITEITELKSGFQNKWQKNQKKVLRTNICMSIGFLGSIFFLLWVYNTYQAEYRWPFKVSIGTTILLMILFSLISWRSYAFKKENLEGSFVEYIDYQIQKLFWQRKMLTQFIWVYSILLWLALVMYVWELTNGATALFRYTALAIITAYLVGLNIWSWYKKQKKQILAIDEMIGELRGLQHKVAGDSM